MELALRPEHSFNTRINYELPYEIDSTVRFNYIGEQFNNTGIGRNTIFKKIDGYSTVALQFGKDFSKSLEGKIGIENLGDKHLDTSEYSYQLRGQFYYVSLNYKF